MQSPLIKWKQMYQTLEATKCYLQGSKTLENVDPRAEDLQYVSGDFINEVLMSLFHDEIDIIHPDTLSLNSLFANQLSIRTEGTFDLLEHLTTLTRITFRRHPSLLPRNLSNRL